MWQCHVNPVRSRTGTRVSSLLLSTRHSSIAVAFSEYSAKFTPFPSKSAPSGNGEPGRTRIVCGEARHVPAGGARSVEGMRGKMPRSEGDETRSKRAENRNGVRSCAFFLYAEGVVYTE